MDSETKAKIKFRLVVGFIILLLSAGVIGWLYKISGIENGIKTPDVMISVAQALPVPVDTHKNLFAVEEEQREVLLEQKREEDELAKKRAKKEKSYECQFWRLQEKQGKSRVASKKIEQYCILSVEENPVKL